MWMKKNLAWILLFRNIFEITPDQINEGIAYIIIIYQNKVQHSLRSQLHLQFIERYFPLTPCNATKTIKIAVVYILRKSKNT